MKEKEEYCFCRRLSGFSGKQKTTYISSPKILVRAVSDEYGDGFCQDILHIESRYKGKWLQGMLADLF